MKNRSRVKLTTTKGRKATGTAVGFGTKRVWVQWDDAPPGKPVLVPRDELEVVP